MLLIFLVLFLIVGFLIADAILDYIFVIVYALLATKLLDSLIHLIRYRKKYHEICTDDIRLIFICIGSALLTSGLYFVLFKMVI